MELTPARLDQVVQVEDGEFVIIGAETSGVVKDLQAMDRRLHVRFAHRAREPFYEVYLDHGPNRPIERVKTVKAVRNRFGVWEGLDDRLVKHFERIDPTNRSGYNFASELERLRKEREGKARHEREERFGEIAERAAHTIRKDTGQRKNGRIFLPREVGK